MSQVQFKDYKDVYSQMADEELLSLATESDSLTEHARSALWDELGTRGLSWQAARVRERDLSELEQAHEPDEELVAVAYFSRIEEPSAYLCKARLESEGIECHLGHAQNPMALGPADIELRVPQSDSQKATEILRSLIAPEGIE